VKVRDTLLHTDVAWLQRNHSPTHTYRDVFASFPDLREVEKQEEGRGDETSMKEKHTSYILFIACGSSPHVK